jgi:hypothetical protein
MKRESPSCCHNVQICFSDTENKKTKVDVEVVDKAIDVEVVDEVIFEDRPVLPPFQLSGQVFPRDVGRLILHKLVNQSQFSLVEVISVNEQFVTMLSLNLKQVRCARSVCKTWHQLLPQSVLRTLKCCDTCKSSSRETFLSVSVRGECCDIHFQVRTEIKGYT